MTDDHAPISFSHPASIPLTLSGWWCFSALKGEVILTDEQNSWLTFDVLVSDVFKKGKKQVNPGDFIQFKKQGSCFSPDLKKGHTYAFMGRDKTGQRVLDRSAWVKEWPEDGPTHKALTDIFGPSFQCK